jgi:hypothetical protein
MPHVPQLLESDVVSVQTPLQLVSPPVHAAPQLPFAHDPDGQTMPHVPQLLGSVPSSVQTPLQRVSPVTHVPVVELAHKPVLQAPLSQTMPQAPQLLMFDCVFTQLPAQSVVPAVHPPVAPVSWLIVPVSVPTMMTGPVSRGPTCVASGRPRPSPSIAPLPPSKRPSPVVAPVAHPTLSAPDANMKAASQPGPSRSSFIIGLCRVCHRWRLFARKERTSRRPVRGGWNT